MKRIVCFILCLVFTTCLCSCLPQNTSSQSTPQSAKERFDPKDVLTPKTFELKERQVRSNSQNLSTQHIHDITYYGYDGELTYLTSIQPNNPYVVTVRYYISSETDALLIDTFPQILADAYDFFGEVSSIAVANTPVDTITWDEILALNDSGDSAYVMWEWDTEKYRAQMRLLISPFNTQKYAVSIEYRNTQNF